MAISIFEVAVRSCHAHKDVWDCHVGGESLQKEREEILIAGSKKNDSRTLTPRIVQGCLAFFEDGRRHSR